MAFNSSAGPQTAANLDALALGVEARVDGFDALDADLAAWLRAVGIAEGSRVTVLRRAVFGGPLHVRVSTGGEFALHRSLARAIRVGGGS